MYLALETLPSDLRRRSKGVTIKHDATHNGSGFLRSALSFKRCAGVASLNIRPYARIQTRQDTSISRRRPFSPAC
jgi:hypothetical protein